MVIMENRSKASIVCGETQQSFDQTDLASKPFSKTFLQYDKNEVQADVSNQEQVTILKDFDNRPNNNNDIAIENQEEGTQNLSQSPNPPTPSKALVSRKLVSTVS